MKKIYSFVLSLITSMMVFSMYAAPGSVPSVSDLSSYNTADNIVLCCYFDGGVCSDVVFTGTYTNWSENPSQCIYFTPLTGFDGWYVVEVPWESYSFGKPVQLKQDGSFSWYNQSGDRDAWINLGDSFSQTAVITDGYSGEADIAYPAAGAYIYEIAYWKDDFNPCEATSHKYTIYFFPPECESVTPAIVGDFDNWQGVPMTKTTNHGDIAYKFTVEDEAGRGFKFFDMNLRWNNEIQYYDATNDIWAIKGQNFILPEVTKDTTLEFNFSNKNMYRWMQCNPAGQIDTITYLDPIPPMQLNFTDIESIDGWIVRNALFNEGSSNFEKISQDIYAYDVEPDSLSNAFVTNVPNIIFSYSNSTGKTNAFNIGISKEDYGFYQTNGKNSKITILNTLKDDTICIYAAAKGGTASDFEDPDGVYPKNAVAVSDDLVLPAKDYNYTWRTLKFLSLGGDVTIKEFAGGYRLREISIIRAADHHGEYLGETSIRDFIESGDFQNIYQLTGIVRGIMSGDNVGQFTLTDSTGSIYVNGLLTADSIANAFASTDVREGDTLTLRAVYSLQNGEPRINDAVFVSRTTNTSLIKPQGNFFIVGGFTNGWDLGQGVEFVDVNGVLTANVSRFDGAFKIVQDRSWDHNWGKTDNITIQLGEKYPLTYYGENIQFNNPLISCYRNAVFTLEQDRYGNYFLTLVEGELEPLEADWYLPNDQIAWECSEATKLTPVTGTNNQFFARFEEFSGNFKVSRGNWAIEFGQPGFNASEINTLYSLSTDYSNVLWVSDKLHNVIVWVTVDFENSEVELEILQEAYVYTVPEVLFPNWEEGDSLQVKITTASGEYSRTGMINVQHGLYETRIVLPDKSVTSLTFSHIDGNGNIKAEKEALQNAITDDGKWENCLYAELGIIGYWIPRPTRQIAISENAAIYFDNSVTHWENVYLRVGRCQSHGYGSDWAHTWPMQHIDNTDIWYAQVDSAIAGEETWLIIDRPGYDGAGQNVFTLPAGCNIIMPSADSIDNNIWMVATPDQTPQVYLLWHYWYSQQRQEIAPSFSLINVPDTLHEGDTLRIGIQSPIPYNYARRFHWETYSNDSRVIFSPEYSVMPAMSTYSEFELSVIDDSNPQKDHAVNLRLYEDNLGLVQTSDTVWIIDDDIPQISLALSAETIGEDAGIRCITATVQRHTLLDRAVTIRFSDNSDGRIYYPENQIVFQTGETEHSVLLGVFNDTQAFGDEQITISAAVYMPSCSCTADETSAGYSSRTLQIVDDDVPALSLSISNNMLLEGKENVAMLTVSRNTPVDTALVVTVTVDNPESLVIPQTIIIPAGSNSASCDISVLKNEVPDDSHSVVFSAMHEGFVAGSCHAMVVDKTLPDAIVEIIHVDRDSVEVNQDVVMTIAIRNQGAAGLAKGVQVALFGTYSQTPLSTFSLPATLMIDSVYELNMSVVAPVMAGTFSYYAEINGDRQVKELFFDNNQSSKVQITVTPPFSVTALTVDKNSYMPGDTVFVTGHASGTLAANSEVEIYAVNNGWRTAFRVMTDENGDFQGEFVPQQGQSGTFAIGACYPSENNTEAMAYARFYGIEASRQPVTCEVTLGYPYEGTLLVKNPGAFPIHNVTAAITGNMADGTITFGEISSIEPGESRTIPFTLQCTAPTAGTAWEKVNIKIQSEELLDASAILYYYCQNPQGQLICSIDEIRNNISARDTSIISFYLRNTGLGETGEISLALPEWMQSLTSEIIPSIASGEYAQVVLRTIPNDMFVSNLNSPILGQIGINPDNCNGMAIPFAITPVSGNYGTLRVDVRDENTYYTEQGPHVKDAQVVIKNVYTGAVISQGLTNEQGIYEISLPEGFYGINVSADDHDAYTNNLFVQPENVSNVVVNLSIRAIEITWTVEETEIEDAYEIVTTVKYETQVPKPVVVIEAPSRIPADELVEGESLMYTVKATNQGLIRAEDVTITLPDGGADFVFEALAYQNPFNLEAKQSVEIPVKVTRMAKPNYAPSKALKYHNIIECQDNMITLYYWDCGTDRKWHQYGIPLIYAKCDERHIVLVDSTGVRLPELPLWGGWPTGHSSGGGYYNPISDPAPPYIDRGCEPCQNKFLLNLINCGISFTPAARYLDMLRMGAGCYNAARQHYDKNKDVLWAVGACLGSQAEPLYNLLVGTAQDYSHSHGLITDSDAERLDKIGQIGNVLSCLASFIEPCDHTAENAASAPVRNRLNEPDSEYADDPEYLARFKSRTKTLYEGLDNYDKYMNLFIDPAMQDYISNAEYIDLLEAWSIVFTGNQDMATLNNYRPAALPEDMWAQLLERMNNTYRFMEGDNSVTENFINPDEAVSYLQKMDECEQKAAEYGYASSSEMLESEHNLLEERLNDNSANVCATITLQFDQKMTMTRQAFRGTLSVFNGHEKTAMTDIHLKLDIYDELGRRATDNEFQINLENLDGMTGEMQLETEDGWTINAKETGVATILFIPTKFAAPTQEVVYSFGGELSYTDPFSGLTVTRQLFPVQMTVSPSPQLELTYFMQRDVFSDDPLTENVVEPTQPTEFALLINNIGYGDAKNVNMTTKEPQIVDNEKGLLIDFRMLHSLLNGKEKSLVINNEIATEFGTIPAQNQMYAQWFFESSLLGHFIEYDVTYTHLTSYDNPNLSLIDSVSIHEMIQSISVPSANPSHTGWLVNDVADANDTPDVLYVSDGSVQDLHIAEAVQLAPVDDKTCILTCIPSTSGWNYGVVEAPMYSWRNISRVTRLSDEAEISLRNVWQTPCILRDGADPVHINRIHIADNIEGTTSYRVEFSDKIINPVYRLSYMVDGNEYAYDSLEYFAPVILLPEPMKEGHTFSGWQNVIDTMPEHNDTIYGTFSINRYQVSFTNYDGAELQSGMLDYGTMPAYTGSTPVKPATAQYTYQFAGWSPEVATVSGAAIYTARYDSIVNQYQVSFTNYDGAELQRGMLDYGTMPAYTGATPVKPATAQYTYQFAGWSPEVVSVSGDAIYTARYDSIVNQYQVSFTNYDGAELQIGMLDYGTMPAYTGATPIKPATAQYTYQFAGWSPEVAAVSGDAIYTARYDSIVNQYQVSFTNYDGAELQSGMLDYGAMPAYTGSTPVKPATAQYTYQFAGWSPEVAAVLGDAIYTVRYDSIVNRYQVSFTNYDGAELQSGMLDYGTMPAYTGATPIKPATAQYTYQFAGWSPEVATVSGAAIYTARYDSIVNQYQVSFTNYDGAELQSGMLDYGAMPAYTGSTPVKPATAQYTYQFAGWSPEVATVSGAAIYTARYDSIVNQYLVVFMDEDSTILCSDEWEYGVIPFCDEPVKEEDAYNWYRFDRWEPEVTIVTEPAVYRAMYIVTPKQGTAIDNVVEVDSPQKVLIGNHVYILRGDKTYTVTGQEVK